jgi:hypothetical protein
MSSNLALPTDIILQVFESLEARNLLEWRVFKFRIMMARANPCLFAPLLTVHVFTGLSPTERHHLPIGYPESLTYKIKLFAIGMCDNLQGDANIAHRSSMLTAYDEALRELKWTGYETIDLQNMSNPCLSDGLLVFRVVGHLAPPNQARLVVFQLPSALRGVRA